MIDTNALRKKILDLAIRGKLVPQNPNDEPASVLIERIREEKQRLIKEGKIKKEKVESVIFKGEDNCYYEKIGNSEPVLLEDLPFDLPNGWAWTRLPSIADVSAGGTPNRGVKKYWENGNIPWLKISDITSVRKYVNKAEEYITEDGLNNSSAQYYEKGTILYTIFATVGEVGILDFRATCNQAIAGIRCYDTNFLDYLYYYLKNLKDFMISQSKGNAQVNINQSKLKAALIAVPPIEEQKRIVNYIQKIFDVIELLENNQNNYTDLVKNLKRAILQSAIQGKLVEQDDTDEPANILLDRIREEKRKQLGKKYIESYIYKGDDNRYYEHIGKTDVNITEEIPFDLPNKWCWVRLGTVGTWGAGATPSRNIPDYYGGNIPWLKTGELNNNVVYDSEEKITEKALKKCSLRYNKKGDILIAMYGATIGKLAIAGVKLTTNQACCACSPFNGIYNLYLFNFLRASKWKLIELGKGGAQPNISKEKIVNFLFPLPPLNEQKRIVDKINELFAKL